MRATFLRLLISWFRRPSVGGGQTLLVRAGGRSEAAKTSRILFTISTLGRPPGPPERLLPSLVAGEESPPPGSPAASLRTISSRKSGAFSSASYTSAPRDVMLSLAIVFLLGRRFLVPTIMEGGGHFRQRAAALLTEDFGRDLLRSPGCPTETTYYFMFGFGNIQRGASGVR